MSKDLWLYYSHLQCTMDCNSAPGFRVGYRNDATLCLPGKCNSVYDPQLNIEMGILLQKLHAAFRIRVSMGGPHIPEGGNDEGMSCLYLA